MKRKILLRAYRMPAKVIRESQLDIGPRSCQRGACQRRARQRAFVQPFPPVLEEILKQLHGDRAHADLAESGTRAFSEITPHPFLIGHAIHILASNPYSHGKLDSVRESSQPENRRKALPPASCRTPVLRFSTNQHTIGPWIARYESGLLCWGAEHPGGEAIGPWA